jgi:hypothetical protein
MTRIIADEWAANLTKVRLLTTCRDSSALARRARCVAPVGMLAIVGFSKLAAEKRQLSVLAVNCNPPTRSTGTRTRSLGPSTAEFD